MKLSAQNVLKGGVIETMRGPRRFKIASVPDYPEPLRHSAQLPRN